MAKKISVVIPCYNQAHWLPKAISSCLNQGLEELEVIVVDDGSPDDVTSAVTPFRSRVQLIRQTNAGPSAARNAGLNAATGDLIKFLDADDYLLPGCLSAQSESISNCRDKVSVIGYRLLFDGIDQPDEDVVPSFGRLAEALFGGNLGPNHAYLFPTELARRVGGFSIDSPWGHEDYNFICKIALAGAEAVSIHEVGCAYRKTPAGVSQDRNRMHWTLRHEWRAYALEALASPQADRLLPAMFQGYCIHAAGGFFSERDLDVLEQIGDRFASRAPLGMREGGRVLDAALYLAPRINRKIYGRQAKQRIESALERVCTTTVRGFNLSAPAAAERVVGTAYHLRAAGFFDAGQAVLDVGRKEHAWATGLWWVARLSDRMLTRPVSVGLSEVAMRTLRRLKRSRWG